MIVPIVTAHRGCASCLCSDMTRHSDMVAELAAVATLARTRQKNTNVSKRFTIFLIFLVPIVDHILDIEDIELDASIKNRFVSVVANVLRGTSVSLVTRVSPATSGTSTDNTLKEFYTCHVKVALQTSMHLMGILCELVWPRLDDDWGQLLADGPCRPVFILRCLVEWCAALQVLADDGGEQCAGWGCCMSMSLHAL